VVVHPERGSFRPQFDFQSRLPSEAVIAAGAEARGKDALELPSLYSEVDPDALDTVFATNPDRGRRSRGLITFLRAGCHVTVNSAGTIVADPAVESERAQ